MNSSMEGARRLEVSFGSTFAQPQVEDPAGCVGQGEEVWETGHLQGAQLAVEGVTRLWPLFFYLLNIVPSAVGVFCL